MAAAFNFDLIFVAFIRANSHSDSAFLRWRHLRRLWWSNNARKNDCWMFT
jgi:hypothetical protein